MHRKTTLLIFCANPSKKVSAIFSSIFSDGGCPERGRPEIPAPQAGFGGPNPKGLTDSIRSVESTRPPERFPTLCRPPRRGGRTRQVLWTTVRSMTRLSRVCSTFVAFLLMTCSAGFAAESPSTNRFFLPQNPVAAAYVLGRLSNQELIAAPRSEFVYVALLQRKGLERKYRLEALEGLSKIRKSDPL